MFGVDDAIVAAGISAGGQLLGGLGKGRTANGVVNQNARQARRITVEHGEAVRAGAERSGFNPLTYLGAIGGPVPGSQTLAEGPTFGDRIASAASAFAQGLTEAQRLEIERTELDQRERELNHRIEQDKVRQAQRSVFNADTGIMKSDDPAMSGNGAVSAPGAVRPKSAWDVEWISVRAPNGKVVEMDKRVADRLRIEPFGQVIQEDVEALLGDLASEPVGIANVPNVATRFFKGDGWAQFLGPNWKDDLAAREAAREKNTGTRQQPKPGWMDEKFK